MDLLLPIKHVQSPNPGPFSPVHLSHLVYSMVMVYYDIDISLCVLCCSLVVVSVYICMLYLPVCFCIIFCSGVHLYYVWTSNNTCCVVLRCVVMCCVLLYCVMLCCLCGVVLCCVVLFCVVWCCVVFMLSCVTGVCGESPRAREHLSRLPPPAPSKGCAELSPVPIPIHTYLQPHSPPLPPPSVPSRKPVQLRWGAA